MKRPGYPVLIAGLALLVAVLAGLSLMAGRVWVPWSAWTSWGADPRWAIIFELRVPRTLLGVLVGAALGATGAALQGYTRNPMADPGILGVSGMAAVGAVLSLYFGMAVASPWLLPAMAMAGAAAGVVLLLLLSGRSSSMVSFILAGMALQTMATAGTALALNLAPTPWAVNEIVNWLLGSLADRSIEEVRLATPFILAGVGLLLFIGRSLDALTLGETGAASLGVDLSRTRLILVTAMALAVGGSVAVTGVIGFVGLLVPHVLRPFVGHRPSLVLPASALAGAIFLLVADIGLRLAQPWMDLRIGVLTALIGAPFFVWLVLKTRAELAP